MKMKLLDYTLIGILAGLAGSASAQEAPAPQDATRCDGSGCASDEGMVFTIRTRGEQRPVTKDTSDGSDSNALQPDRRVTVEAERVESTWNHDLKPGQALAIGKWSTDLPGGGVIWATEDPNLGQPQYSVSAPSMVAFDGGRITKPVRFYAYTNYPDFIQRAEVLISRASDADLVSPLATVPMPVGAVTDVEWDGTLPAGFEARAGDELVYLVRAYGADGLSLIHI